MSESAKQVLKRFFSTMDAAQWDRYRALLHPEHVVRIPVSPEPLDADAHVAMNQEFQQSFPGFSHTIDGQSSDGEFVATWGRISMKHSAPFRGIPATNKEFEIAFMNVARVVDGRVREEWAQVDTLKLMTEIGAVAAARV